MLKRLDECWGQLQIRILETPTHQMNLNQKELIEELSKSHEDPTINSIHEFHFGGLVGVTFDFWFTKHEKCSRLT